MVVSFNCFSQDAYMNIMDTNAHGLFKNFVGVKLFGEGIGTSTINQDLQFKYVSNNMGSVYTFQHDMNVSGLNNFYNLGLGMEENLGKHLSINFFDASIGYAKAAWNWNAGAGAGYFFSLTKEQDLRLNLYANVYYECITYSFGSYYDTTGLGFLVDGVNVGSLLHNVKYVANIWSVSPGAELLYRRNNFDYFISVSYNYVFSYSQEINFYLHSISTDYNNEYGILTQAGNPVNGNILNTNKYTIHIGIIREFGI